MKLLPQHETEIRLAMAAVEQQKQAAQAVFQQCIDTLGTKSYAQVKTSLAGAEREMSVQLMRFYETIRAVMTAYPEGQHDDTSASG